jgi:hypothetical protein
LEDKETTMRNEMVDIIKFKAEAILRREVMEANCQNFTELADKMAQQIVNICDDYNKLFHNKD